jgi:hypothetical protein
MRPVLIPLSQRLRIETVCSGQDVHSQPVAELCNALITKFGSGSCSHVGPVDVMLLQSTPHSHQVYDDFTQMRIGRRGGVFVLTKFAKIWVAGLRNAAASTGGRR